MDNDKLLSTQAQSLFMCTHYNSNEIPVNTVLFTPSLQWSCATEKFVH